MRDFTMYAAALVVLGPAALDLADLRLHGPARRENCRTTLSDTCQSPSSDLYFSAGLVQGIVPSKAAARLGLSRPVSPKNPAERMRIKLIHSPVYLNGQVDGELIRNMPRARRKDLDAISWPAWDLFDVDLYNEYDLVNGLHAGKTIPILATRGCPYQCTYCSNPGMWTTAWYARTPALVVDEIESYAKHQGAKNFPFQDLTAILKRDWVIEFCNEILARKLEITWQFPSGTRCEVIDDEVARLLRLSGGRSLAFAPESGSERTRKLIKKRMKTSSLMNAVKASVREKLNITVFIVLGFPHDTKEDLKHTTRLARKLGFAGIDDIAVGFFFPIPNTELYDQLMEQGRVDLSDRFLLTPIYANDEKLDERNNYCDHLKARTLTLWKYRILFNFYAISMLTHPWRAFTLAWNVMRGKETRKMETFLIELKRKIWVKIKGKLGRNRVGNEVKDAEYVN